MNLDFHEAPSPWQKQPLSSGVLLTSDGDYLKSIPSPTLNNKNQSKDVSRVA